MRSTLRLTCTVKDLKTLGKERQALVTTTPLQATLEPVLEPELDLDEHPFTQSKGGKEKRKLP
uniref:Uncharacterized protein n=1 Tax=Arundo donax TaxID=35708 RepID=A0A0A9DT66_ARUDO